MKKYIRSSIVTWPNGKAVTNDELIDAVMYMYGEDMKAAKEDIRTLSAEQLQKAVNYYAEKVDIADDTHISAVSFDFINDAEFDYNDLGIHLMNTIEVFADVECLGFDLRDVDYSSYPEYRDEVIAQGGIDFKWSGEYDEKSITSAIEDTLSSYGYELIGIDFYSHD